MQTFNKFITETYFDKDKTKYTYDELENIPNSNKQSAKVVYDFLIKNRKYITADINKFLGGNIKDIEIYFYEHENFRDYSLYFKFRYMKSVDKNKLMFHLCDNSLKDIFEKHYFEVKKWYSEYIIDFEYIIQ